MINSETFYSVHTTVADSDTVYPVGFVYSTNSSTGVPELYVTLDGEPLTYGEDYTVGIAGLQLIATPEAGLSLEIHRDVPFTQEIDFQTGLIDPNQIEQGFDRTVMRDQEIVDDVDSLSARVEEIEDEYVKSDDLATVATTGSYNDLIDKPSVGAVDSVNGKTGVVVLNATDVGALPNTTKYGASLVLSINSSTYVLTATLKDQNGNTLGTAQTIDLPLESVVVSGAYDSATKEVVLTLQSGSVVRFSVADLVSGLQTEITSQNMLSADLVDDTNSTHKFVTAGEKTAISTAVQPRDLATVATSGSYNDLSDRPIIQDIRWATPWITTYQQIKDWFDNKKTVLINATPDIYYLSKIDASAAHFTRTTGTVIEELWVYTSNEWASAQWYTQLLANLVTSVSSASTDSQYPSAKLFYDTCGNIESLINAL